MEGSRTLHSLRQYRHTYADLRTLRTISMARLSFVLALIAVALFGTAMGFAPVASGLARTGSVSLEVR